MKDNTIFVCGACLKQVNDIEQLAVGMFGLRSCEICGEIIDTETDGCALIRRDEYYKQIT